MRHNCLTILLCLCLSSSIAQIRPAGKLDACTALENIIRSSLNYFSANRLDQPKVYTQQEEWLREPRQYNYKRYNTRLLWPSATANYILNRQDDVNDEIEEYTFKAELPVAKTEAAAMQQLQKIMDELSKCNTLQIIDGQRDTLRTKLTPLNNRPLMYSTILSKTYPYNGITREVWAATSLAFENGTYQPGIVVRVSVNRQDIIVKKRCELINELIKSAYTNFRGQYGNQISAKDRPLANGVSTSSVDFETKFAWPQMIWKRVINDKIKKDNVTKYDSWKYTTWITRSNYEDALYYYQRLYKQINECTVLSPSGKTYVLSGKYEEPATTLSGKKRGLTVFSQLFETEGIELSVELIFDNNTWYAQLTVSKSSKY